MKKRIVKKIVLTKETLRTLADNNLSPAVGGASLMPDTCNASCQTDVTCVTCRGIACNTVNTGCC